MKPEEIESALEKLWTKVAEPRSAVETPPALPIFEFEPASRGAAIEALALVKRQHREQQARWENALELKETDVQSLRETLRSAESELETLRRRCQRFDARLVEEVSLMAQKLEAAHGLLREEERKSQLEEQRLSTLVQGLESENRGHVEAQAKLRQSLEDCAKRAAEAGAKSHRMEQEVSALQAALKEGRDAVAATLSEFLSERQARELAEDRAEQAESQLEEWKSRFARMEKLWQEERRQWTSLVEARRPAVDS